MLNCPTEDIRWSAINCLPKFDDPLTILVYALSRLIDQCRIARKQLLDLITLNLSKNLNRSHLVTILMFSLGRRAFCDSITGYRENEYNIPYETEKLIGIPDLNIIQSQGGLKRLLFKAMHAFDNECNRVLQPGVHYPLIRRVMDSSREFKVLVSLVEGRLLGTLNDEFCEVRNATLKFFQKCTSMFHTSLQMVTDNPHLPRETLGQRCQFLITETLTTETFLQNRDLCFLILEKISKIPHLIKLWMVNRILGPVMASNGHSAIAMTNCSIDMPSLFQILNHLIRSYLKKRLTLKETLLAHQTLGQSNSEMIFNEFNKISLYFTDPSVDDKFGNDLTANEIELLNKTAPNLFASISCIGAKIPSSLTNVSDSTISDTINHLSSSLLLPCAKLVFPISAPLVSVGSSCRTNTQKCIESTSLSVPQIEVEEGSIVRVVLHASDPVTASQTLLVRSRKHDEIAIRGGIDCSVSKCGAGAPNTCCRRFSMLGGVTSLLLESIGSKGKSVCGIDICIGGVWSSFAVRVIPTL